jgi:hypothetical protein
MYNMLFEILGTSIFCSALFKFYHIYIYIYKDKLKPQNIAYNQNNKCRIRTLFFILFHLYNEIIFVYR